MRLLFLGPPGAGKGTQAKLVAERYGLIHVAPGDIFRQEVKKGSELGRLVEGIMARGELVPDEITVRVMEQALSAPEAMPGFVLDGFPRNLAQAVALDKMLAAIGQRLDKVISLEVGEDELIERARTRRVCLACGRPYNLRTNAPAVAGRCDVCGGELVQRQDDREETVRERLRVYNDVTRPLCEYYGSQGILVRIDGSKTVDEVFSRISELIAGTVRPGESDRP